MASGRLGTKAGGLTMLERGPRPCERRRWRRARGGVKQKSEVRPPHRGVHGRTPADPAQRARGKGRVKAPLRRARGADPKRRPRQMSREAAARRVMAGGARKKRFQDCFATCAPHRGRS
jgi:hypothetical protein